MCNILGEMVLFWAKLNYYWQDMSKSKVDQSRNLAEIGWFLTQRQSIVHFLLLVLFFTVLLVVFGGQSSLIARTTQLTTLNPQLQVAITALVGVVLLTVSRFSLRALNRRQSISHMGYLLWLLVELVVEIASMSLVLWQLSGGGKLQLAALAADLLLSIIVVESLPYVIAFQAYRLREERAEVARLQSLLESQSFASSSSDTPPEGNINFFDKAGRLSFSILASSVLYVEAADNYVNIHYLKEGREETFILHNTMKLLEDTLSDTQLMRCHRGYMVNMANVKLLRREHAQLLLELEGCAKNIPVTKTYAAAIMERIAPTIG